MDSTDMVASAQTKSEKISHRAPMIEAKTRLLENDEKEGNLSNIAVYA
jgi:hypothetical protein